MKVVNEFSLNLDSRSINEAFCRTVVSSFITPLDPNIEEITDIKTAVSEAVTNSIVHGYKNVSGKLYINGQILDNSTVRFIIKDKGVGIKDVEQAMQPLYSTGGDDRAGLGFTVMQSFCDRIKVSSKPDKGTTVTLTKRIRGKNQW